MPASVRLAKAGLHALKMVVEQQSAGPLVRRALVGDWAILGVADQAAVKGDPGHVPMRIDQVGEHGVQADVLEASVSIVPVEPAAARVGTVDAKIGLHVV